MASKARLVAAMKAVPGTRGSVAPQASGMGRISPVASEMYFNNPYRNTYGPFLPRPPEQFSDGAFGPMPPIQPVPVDQPPLGGQFPDPRWWQYTQGWNLPTPPGTEGLKLASFDQLATLANKYSVARSCIDLREQEIRGLGWEIAFTKDAAKAYQGDHHAMKDAGERIAKLRRFFRHPDPEYWTFDSFLNALLEEIFVYDALSLIFRPKYGEQFGMGGRGLLNSNLDSVRLVSGPTIRPLVDLHGGHPAPPAPAYQQFLYGVPRSDYQTMMRGEDIDEEMLWGAKYNDFTADIMMYDPYWPRRESPYGQPPVEKALLPIISGLQLQEYQLDYFTEGSVPAVYISPGDNNITPVQVQELQTALNGIAGDKAFHMKVVVLPPGSKVDPQRPVDLSSGFDELVMEQVCMAFDVMPIELGIIPDIGGSGAQGPSASSIRFSSQEARDVKSRKSTKPLLQHICSIFNYVIQDICGCEDLQFQFEGLADDEDKQAITELGVQQVQNGIASIDEVRDRLDLPPWGLSETSEPVVFTAQGPIPFSMAPQLIAAMQGGQQQQSSGGNNRTQGTSSGQRTSSSRSTSKQPAVRQGGQTKPNGSHPAPVSPHRESLTPGHSAASGAIQSSTPRTGGTTSRSSVAGSRKKAVEAELQSLSRHLRKGRLITSWEPVNINDGTLARIAEDIAKGVLIDIACERAGDLLLEKEELESPVVLHDTDPEFEGFKASHWPGWDHDQDIVKTYKGAVADAFKEADIAATAIRQKAAKGQMFVNGPTLRSLISEEVSETFSEVLKPMWTEAYSAGYQAGVSLCTGEDPDLGIIKDGSNLRNFIDTEGQHWLEQISRTGMKNQIPRAEIIARTEVARAMNAGAIQAYRDHRVQLKHLLVAPDDTCDICKGAEAEGDIPLDSIFPSGGLGGPFHPNCRCVPAPAGIEVVPPQATKSESWLEDPTRAAFLLMRAPHPETAKSHYLLQKRKDDSWGMPGGTTHLGEHPLAAAIREATEEVGDLPLVQPSAYLMHQDGDRTVHIFVCDMPWFSPKLNGSTPEETSGTGWFRKKEIPNLNLHPKFKKQWDRIDWSNINKNTHQIVTENGEQLTVTDPGEPLFPAGARWPYPHRSDGAEDPHYGTAYTPEPPNDMSSGTHTRVYEDDDTDGFPKKRTRNQGPRRQAPQGKEPASSAGDAGSGVADIGSATGVPPSGEKASGRPVVGSVPAVAPKPGNPTSVPPQAFDPGETVESWSDEDESNTYVPLPPAGKKSAQTDADLADPKKPGGPSDYSDPNPVNAEHVMNMMRSNFPEEAIQWVMRARWIGPINVPWNRIE